ncbi:hypothetical protein RE6C_01061 [Rhodopirellula europaea 6C]|uniref:Uncharacterized protein n=1 Tax=Rhodopirellula europaea 6C TaxID=1263867 RepID=M2A8I8_9BACT|nr:hypothetical protein RE6C_01061 [Rhodopirellula europaea 6C]
MLERLAKLRRKTLTPRHLSQSRLQIGANMSSPARHNRSDLPTAAVAKAKERSLDGATEVVFARD